MKYVLPLLALIPLAGHAADQVKPIGESYAGPKGEMVEIAWLKAGGALVKVSGVNSDWNEKVEKASVTTVEGRKQLHTPHGNKDFVILTEQPVKDDKARYDLFLPDDDTTAPIPLAYSPSDTRPLHLLSAYEGR